MSDLALTVRSEHTFEYTSYQDILQHFRAPVVVRRRFVF